MEAEGNGRHDCMGSPILRAKPPPPASRRLSGSFHRSHLCRRTSVSRTVVSTRPSRNRRSIRYFGMSAMLPDPVAGRSNPDSCGSLFEPLRGRDGGRGTAARGLSRAHPARSSPLCAGPHATSSERHPPRSDVPTSTVRGLGTGWFWAAVSREPIVRRRRKEVSVSIWLVLDSHHPAARDAPVRRSWLVKAITPASDGRTRALDPARGPRSNPAPSRGRDGFGH